MDANVLELKGQIVDVVNDRIFSGAIYIHDGQIVDVKEEQHDEKQLIMPGLVDAHIHIDVRPIFFWRTAWCCRAAIPGSA